MNHKINKVAQLATKNIGLAIIDTFTLGLGTGIKDTVQQIKEYSTLCNDALYTLQIETFLQTVELNEQQVKQFFDNNKDNQRLGLEVFKILESTYLEKQASMLAVIFSAYVNGNLERSKFDKYVNLISKIDNHVWNMIVEDLKYAEIIKDQGFTDIKLPENVEDIFSVGNFQKILLSKSNELRVIGFIEDEISETPLTLSGSIKPETKSKRTHFYLDFYLDIFRNLK